MTDSKLAPARHQQRKEISASPRKRGSQASERSASARIGARERRFWRLWWADISSGPKAL